MENIRIESDLRFVQNIPVLDVVGEIDIYTTPQFKEAVSAAIDQGGPAVVINMKKVSYMDSSGFGTLLSATKKLRPMNGSLILTACARPRECAAADLKRLQDAGRLRAAAPPRPRRQSGHGTAT